MQRATARHQLRAFRPRQLAEGVGQRLGRQRRIEPRERITQALGQHHLPVVIALGGRLAGGDGGAVADPPAGTFEPGDGGLFYDGFAEAAHSITCQCPPLSGPMRTRRPDSRSDRMAR